MLSGRTPPAAEVGASAGWAGPGGWGLAPMRRRGPPRHRRWAARRRADDRTIDSGSSVGHRLRWASGSSGMPARPNSSSAGVDPRTPTMRSTYLAITSTSRLTRSPTCRLPIVVAVGVWAVGGTENPGLVAVHDLDNGE